MYLHKPTYGYECVLYSYTYTRIPKLNKYLRNYLLKLKINSNFCNRGNKLDPSPYVNNIVLRTKNKYYYINIYFF